MNIHILHNKKFINVEFTGNWDIAGLRPTGFFLWLRPSLQRYLVARSGLRLLRLLSTESKLRPFGLKNPFERKADILSALTFALRAKQRPVFDGSSLMRGEGFAPAWAGARGSVPRDDCHQAFVILPRIAPEVGVQLRKAGVDGEGVVIGVPLVLLPPDAADLDAALARGFCEKAINRSLGVRAGERFAGDVDVEGQRCEIAGQVVGFGVELDEVYEVRHCAISFACVVDGHG